jgi:hypothetical protein
MRMVCALCEVDIEEVEVKSRLDYTRGHRDRIHHICRDISLDTEPGKYC